MKRYSAHSLFSLALRPCFEGSVFKSEKYFKMAQSVWMGSLLRHQLRTAKELSGGSVMCSNEGSGVSGSSADSLSLVILYKGRGKKNEGAAEL